MEEIDSWCCQTRRKCFYKFMLEKETKTKKEQRKICNGKFVCTTQKKHFRLLFVCMFCVGFLFLYFLSPPLLFKIRKWVLVCVLLSLLFVIFLPFLIRYFPTFLVPTLIHTQMHNIFIIFPTWIIEQTHTIRVVWSINNYFNDFTMISHFEIQCFETIQNWDHRDKIKSRSNYLFFQVHKLLPTIQL